MGWSPWMVPTLTPQRDLELRGHELELLRAATTAPEAVAALAASLLRQNAMLDSIVRQATHRIAELEAREAVAERRPAPRRVGWWARFWRQSA
jgi:hypothetical protein